MDHQMKRGLLDICVLPAIRREDSYGYQIIKEIHLRGYLPEPLQFWEAGSGGGTLR